MRKNILIGLVALLTIVALFYFAPIPVGLDFTIIHAALLKFAQGETTYQHFPGGGYFYPPWLTAILSPLALMDIRLAWVLVNCLSLMAVVAIANRFKLPLVHTGLLLLSPPVFYNLMQGQIDALLLMALFIPRQLWPLVALAKPQTAIGFGFAIFRRSPSLILEALLISLAIFFLSLVALPDWPLQVIAMGKEQFAGLIPQNFLNIWPINLIVFFALISMAVEQDDERLYISASPFFMKYASVGSYVGVLLAAFTVLKGWQAALVVFVWWFVLFVR